MTGLVLLAFAKRVGTGVMTWLGHRSFWQLVCIALLGLAAVQRYQTLDARHDAASYAKQRDALKAELDRISTANNAQRDETAKRIVIVKEQVRHADSEAKRIEQAPLPGQCRTPDPIMGADL